MIYLYRITNKINDKVYIGQTSNWKKRWSQHIYYAKNPDKTSQYIHRAMAKYGVDAFIFEIIASAITRVEASEIENMLISQYKACDSQYGYNLTVGVAYGGHSEETRKKLSASYTKYLKENGHPCQGQKRTPEQIERITNGLLNREDYFTPELRQRMSDSHKGKKQAPEQIEKKVKSLAETNARKLEQKIQSGELKCNVIGCNVSGIYPHYRIINELRYCATHAARFKSFGSFELIPERKEQGRLKLLGRKAHNKCSFTEEQINNILSDTRAAKKVGQDYGVSENTILRIRKSHNVSFNKQKVVILSSEQTTNIINLYVEQLWSVNKIAKKHNVDMQKIRQFLIKKGIKIRSRSEQAKINNSRKNS